MCRAVIQDFLLDGPQGPHGWTQLLGHDMAHFRQLRDELKNEQHEDGSYWRPAGDCPTPLEHNLSKSPDKVFPKHHDQYEMDGIEYL